MNENNSQVLEDQITTRDEKTCEIAFWMSIAGLIFSFFGQAFGIFLYIFEFIFAARGLKTRKRGKAIATIVMAIISLVILAIQVFVMMY